jgi:hypothetical protein
MTTKDTVSVVKAEKESGRKAPRQLNAIRSKAPQFLNTWANSANVTISFFDIKITFGVVENVDESRSEIHIQDAASISMSPEHAKAVAELLSSHLDLYEKTYGALRHTPLPDSAA